MRSKHQLKNTLVCGIISLFIFVNIPLGQLMHQTQIYSPSVLIDKTSDLTDSFHSSIRTEPTERGSDNWWNTNWGYRRQITIDHTKVAGDLFNFPVLVKTTIDADKVQHNGDDIVFTDSQGMKLNHEIESYDSNSGSLIVWVNVPSLSSSQDTILYMYYGNPTCVNQQNITGTWDVNYLAVWHLNDARDAKDSTYNHNATAVVDPVYQTTGKIGYAQTYSGGQYLIISNPSTMVGLDAISIEAWAKLTSDATGEIIANTFDATYEGEVWRFLYLTSGSFLFRMGNGYQDIDALAPGVSLGTWYYVTGTWFKGMKSSIYKNGTLSSQSVTSLSEMINRTDTDGFIGVEYSYHSNFTWYLYGIVDEIRISDKARSSDWIKTSYNNENDPISFTIIGNEQVQLPNPPPITGPSWGLINVMYTFCITMTNPNGDNLYCKWDWGDGNITDWLGPYSSGEMICASHAWSQKGSYEIRVKLKDEYGLETNWSDPHIIDIYELKKSFMLGRYTNLSTEEGFINVDALSLWTLHFNPFEFKRHIPPEKIIFSDDYVGIKTKQRLIGVFNIAE
jgi:hypothetical protein